MPKEEEEGEIMSISEENEEEATQNQEVKNDAINKMRLQVVKVSRHLSSDIYILN